MNIVFDLGGVVFEWLPDRLVKSAFSDPKTQVLVRNEIITHPDWLELDRGSLPLEQAISRGAQRTGMSETELSDFFDQAPPSLTPIQESIDLIHELHESGEHRLFVLSNMHRTSIAHLESNYDFWSLFHARVISCRIGMVKPEPEIFRYLLESNGIDAQETVFIDDMQENVDAAAKHGINTIQFHNTRDCKRQLITMIGAQRLSNT